jgi:high-affinity iron transporter
VQSALLTGMLGVQEHPVLIEVIGWFAYLVPVGVFVAWPPNRSVSRRTLVRAASALAGLGVVATALLLVLAPSSPAANPATSAGSFSARLAATPGQTAVLRTVAQSPAGGTPGSDAAAITVHRTGSAQHAGLATDVYTASVPGNSSAGRPTQLTYEQVAALNGGRLPLGVRTSDAGATVQVQYTDTSVLTAWVEPRTGRVVDLRWTEQVLATLTGTQVGTVPLDSPVATGTAAMPAAASAAAASAARAGLSALDRRSALTAGADAAGTVAVLALLGLASLLLTGRRNREGAAVTQITRAPSTTTADRV